MCLYGSSIFGHILRSSFIIHQYLNLLNATDKSNVQEFGWTEAVDRYFIPDKHCTKNEVFRQGFFHFLRNEMSITNTSLLLPPCVETRKYVPDVPDKKGCLFADLKCTEFYARRAKCENA